MTIQSEAEPPCGIVFAGERSEIVSECAEKLHSLGLLRKPSELADDNFFAALASFRESRGLPRVDYLDPVTVRLLCSIEVSGDELILLAACTDSDATEIEKFDFCLSTIKNAHLSRTTCSQYLLTRYTPCVMPDAVSVKCAMLATLASGE